MLQRLLPRRTWTWVAAALLALLTCAAALFAYDMHAAHERVNARGTVISSPQGNIEYTTGGSGPPVLVIHGSGGGYDQGELLAGAVLGGQFRSIVPSRFGYLRSTFNEGATFDDQAHAYAALLDRLGVKRVAVVAMSHGGPSALLFAVLYPERVSSLTLLSAGVAASAAASQAQANRKGEMLMTIFQHDVPYWIVCKLFRGQLMRLMGASDTVVAGLSPGQRQLVDQIIDFMNPASLRSAGTAFDNKAAMPNARITAIRAPTLVIHAADDQLQLFHNAEYAAATIPGARLAPFDKGGHLLVSVEQAAIRTMVQKHIVDHGP